MNKILIIDDDARLVKNLSTYLKDFNYQTGISFSKGTIIKGKRMRGLNSFFVSGIKVERQAYWNP